MKKTLKFLMLFAIGLFLALSVTSCGDDDDDDTNSSNPSNNGQQGGSNPDSNVTPKPDDNGTNSEPAKTFTVTFNTDGGSEVVAQNVEEGKTATKPENPSKEGFNFEGWFNGENLYDFASPVTSDLTLTAQWKIKTFTVTFNTDGGSEVAAQTVEDGKSATKPENPSKEGFWFLGWYVGENGYEFTQPISDDLTVTAKWMEKTEYDVDLGLPSGTIWASCNVGAQNPWDYGDYFSWGEITPKDNYDWDTYKYQNSDYLITKYCNESSYGYNGFTDNLTVLLPEDDAATANIGKDWRMPTQAEIQELHDNCDWEWTSNYNGTGVAGRIVKSRITSNSIFLPAAGYRDGTDLFNAGSYGYYWSSSLTTDVPNEGRSLFFNSGLVYPDSWSRRHRGQSVRPVRCRN